MTHNDCIFGKVKIEEPVILDLIKSKTLQRLKGIDQGGYQPLFAKPKTVLDGRLHHNRFAHSLGVYLLLKRYNVSLEEQIAGLIHDVSHACFSHCIDYVLAEGCQKTQSHQDNIFADFIKQTEIPAILKKYKINPEYILDDNKFPLKERLLPELCADRIEYCLRTALVFGEADKAEAINILDNLFVEKNRWIFKNFQSAKKFAGLFSIMNRVYFSGVPTAIMFLAVGDCLKHALGRGYINKKDLYATDAVVIKKIKSNLSKDKKLKLLFDRMSGGISCENNPRNYESRVFCKSRVVDPLCRHQGKIARVSDIDKSWAATVKNEMEPKEYFLKFEH